MFTRFIQRKFAMSSSRINSTIHTAMKNPMLPLRSKRTIIFIAACALFTPATVLFYSNSQAQDANKPAAAASAPKPALSVQTVRPQQSSLPLQLAANGSVQPWQEAVIGAEVNGLRLSDVRVSVGERVRRGQVLAVFDGASVQADLAQVRASIAEAESSVAEAQAAAAEAAANAERARTLKDTGALSTQQILQFTTAEQSTKVRVQAAQARVQSAKAQLAAQNLRVKHTQVTAPDDGVISARLATVGAVASPGQELFRLIRKSRLEWRGEVTSSEITRLGKDTKVRLTAASGAQVDGRVRMVAPTVDAQTRNGLVYVDVPEHPGIKAGMFARGEFEMGAAQAVTLPASALVLRDGFNYAFRIDPGNKVSQVKLQVGRRVGERVEVINGIKTDQSFVASGAAFLADGDTVRIVAAPGGAPVAAASAAANPK
jgi:HlyD family secretion protein